MQYLGLALYAEGRTDYYFLCPLLRRLCEDICANNAHEPIDVSDVLELSDTEDAHGKHRHERIACAALSAKEAWRILFIHADSDGNALSARTNRVEPALALLMQEKDIHGIGVAVIPIREMESWAIADGDAIRSAFGTPLDNRALGLPIASRSVEQIVNPKSVLQSAFNATRPSSRRIRQGTSPYLSMIGEQISLNVLRTIPSFKCLDDELRSALRQLQIIR